MPARRIRLAAQVAPQHATYPHIRDTVRELDELGIDILFNWDHFFPLRGERDGAHFECWTELASWAELTTHAELGTLVNCNSYRNPDLQADMARTIDHISAGGAGTGRFIFGTGAGWFQRDYDEYGYEFGTPGTRIADLAAAMPRIRARWEKLNPAPTRRIPVLIGGSGERKTLRIVAEHADIWHSFASVEDLPRKQRILAEHGAAVGRDTSQIEVSVEIGRKTERDADAYVAAGATLFTVGLSGPRYDVDLVKRWLRWRDAARG